MFLELQSAVGVAIVGVEVAVVGVGVAVVGVGVAVVGVGVAVVLLTDTKSRYREFGSMTQHQPQSPPALVARVMSWIRTYQVKLYPVTIQSHCTHKLEPHCLKACIQNAFIHPKNGQEYLVFYSFYILFQMLYGFSCYNAIILS
ncbi:hypothetical protein NEOLI_004665 [Neolecta irregularis DAH-3]|uniref:Uncharacterized protein n=1 Tax=Neolecta irregularis (strain DAH-3) TaxID=1198029 RepID=A0A1U7LMU2_NEOID|nr:hypothetical protein NEOLI_004665 [Neolecta irregularis DAH-3]|eukprot:OLL23862.1 hypothetical protein NEOLI_004665 [Neolecta irregularis DAH-3]